LHSFTIKNEKLLLDKIGGLFDTAVQKFDTYFNNYVIDASGNKVLAYIWERQLSKDEESDEFVSEVPMNKPPLSDEEKQYIHTKLVSFINLIQRKNGIKLQDILQNPNQDQKDMFASLLLSLLQTYFQNRYGDNVLYACDCISVENRILLALRIIGDAMQQFTPNEKIVYTSLASGSLLQDYLIVTELAKKFPNLEINLIDVGYLPDTEQNALQKVAKEVNDTAETQFQSITESYVFLSPHTNQGNSRMQNHLNFINDYMHNKSVNAILKFKELVTKSYPTTHVQLFNSAYDYIRRLEKNPDERTNILVLTDPDAGYFGIESYPKDANVLSFWSNSPTQQFILFMPHYSPSQLLQLKGSAKDPQSIAIKCALIELLLKTQGDKKYSPQFIQELLKQSFVQKIVEDAQERELDAKLSQAHTLVIREIAKLFPKLMQKPLKIDADMSSENDAPHIFELLDIGGHKILLTFGSDAYITLHDLIMSGLAPKNMVYTADIDDHTAEESPDKVTKINVNEYKKLDIVKQKSNRIYVTGTIGGDYEEKEHYQIVPLTKCPVIRKK
jgi:hypothetical protein